MEFLNWCKMKDWIGDKNSTYKTLGASSHTDEERAENDYYATPPKAVDMLLLLEGFSTNIWEVACGGGHISKVIVEAGHTVKSTDLYDRGFGESEIDFLKVKGKWDGDIISNPPYKYAQEFVEKSLQVITQGHKVAMFLKIQFLEGKKRKKMFLKYPPKTVYVSSSRLLCAKNGKFGKGKGFIKSSAVAYCWFLWTKGHTGDTIIKWFN